MLSWLVVSSSLFMAMNDQTFILLNFWDLCTCFCCTLTFKAWKWAEQHCWFCYYITANHCYLHFVVFHVSMLSCGINFVFALYKLYLEALTVFTALLMKITNILLLYNNVLKHSWLLVAVQKKIILLNSKATKWTTYLITSYLLVCESMHVTPKTKHSHRWKCLS